MRTTFITALALTYATVQAQQFLQYTTVPEACLGETILVGPSTEGATDFDQAQSYIDKAMPVEFRPVSLKSCVNAIVPAQLEPLQALEATWNDPNVLDAENEFSAGSFGVDVADDSGCTTVDWSIGVPASATIKVSTSAGQVVQVIFTDSEGA